MTELGDVDHDGDRDLRDAALAAEYVTGVRETTEQRAWYHVIVRVVRITFGFLTLIVGLLMLIFPGPAIVVIPAGLAILARDFAWAQRALLFAQDKANQAKDKATGRSGTVMLVVAAIAILAYGLWYWQTDQNFRCWSITPDSFTCPDA